MDIQALVNNGNIHDSPSAERFYQLQLQKLPPQPQLGSVQRGIRHSKPLTRDEKLKIRTIRECCKWDYFKIAQATGKTYHQVQDALFGPLTPQKNKRGRKPLLTTPQKAALAEFLREDPLNLKLPWADLRYYIPGFELYGEHAIKTALRSLASKMPSKRQGISVRSVVTPPYNEQSFNASVESAG